MRPSQTSIKIPAFSERQGFTLIELLVVVAIISLLVAILLPALGKAREAANAVKCGANLHSVGQGMALYTTEFGVFPASNYYNGLNVSGGGQTPSDPSAGYVHWSSFLYANSSQAAGNYTSTDGWKMFLCPSIPNGGLLPANSAITRDDGLPNETPGVVDLQAPRLGYTVNEAICPRGIFVQGFRGANRPYHFVTPGQVQNASGTILATELWSTPSVVETTSLMDGTTMVSASRRPVHGFTIVGTDPDKAYLAPVPRGASQSLAYATLANLDKDPSANPPSVVSTLLTWVGRNHGTKTKDAQGYDARKTNFVYVDGHVEYKRITETLTGQQWGSQFYSLTPGGDVSQ